MDNNNTSIWIPTQEGGILGVKKLFKIPDLTDKDIEKERAAKALKLNGFGYDYTPIYPISKQIGSKVKPTIHIKRLKREHDNPIRYLKGASAIQDKLKRKREKAEKALKLNNLFS